MMIIGPPCTFENLTMEKVKAEVRVNDMWYAPIRKLTMNLYVREVIFKFITRGLK